MSENKKMFAPNLGAGLLFAFLLAGFSKIIEGFLPGGFIGASVIALFLGVIINFFWPVAETKLANGVNFASKRVLKFAIILLGASLNIVTIMEVGKISMTVMVFTLVAAFGGGYLLGKALGMDWKLSSLISAGTGVCGGSAIAAVSPVIEAEDYQIAYAMSTTFIFDMLMIILFPLMGRALNLSDISYGLWTGTAVNDTSSVVAAGYAFSEAAGDFATMVKLTRTLSIIPIVVIFSFIQLYNTRKQALSANQKTKQKVQFNLREVFPWFILGFVLMAIFNSIGWIPANVAHLVKDLSKFLMVVALGAIGLKTDLTEMQQSGVAPFLHGFLISLLVVVVSIAAQYFLGIV